MQDAGLRSAVKSPARQVFNVTREVIRMAASRNTATVLLPCNPNTGAHIRCLTYDL